MKFINVETVENARVENGREVKRIFTTFRNSYYEIRKTETFFVESGSSYTNYDVLGLDREMEMPTIYIKSSWDCRDEQKFSVEVTTTGFGYRDLDFIDAYAKKLLKAVECARIIEGMLETKEL